MSSAVKPELVLYESQNGTLVGFNRGVRQMVSKDSSKNMLNKMYRKTKLQINEGHGIELCSTHQQIHFLLCFRQTNFPGSPYGST